MKLLCIGNSFSQDACTYMTKIATAGNFELTTVNLFIGGCSLYRHYRCMLSEDKAYSLYVCGVDSGFKVSLKEALLSDEWDIVTLQQVSNDSGDFSTYEPFLSELSAYVKKLAPKAKQYIHAIWAWGDAKIAASTTTKYKSSAEMYAADHASYKKAAVAIDADGYIPSISAMEKLYAKMGESAYRDGFHASYGMGRYMLSLVWYMTIFGKDNIDAVNFSDFDIPVTDEEKAVAELCAIEAVRENNYKK